MLYGGTAGVPFDPCYHQLCDTLENISEQGFEEHKDAAVHAILTFAQTTSSVHGTDQGSTRRGRPGTGRATSWSAKPRANEFSGAPVSAGAPFVSVPAYRPHFRARHRSVKLVGRTATWPGLA